MKGSTALAAAGALSGSALTDWAKAWAQAAPWKPEKGAKINLMRWRRFVQAEDEAFVKMVNAFKAATGVDIVVTNELFEDIQPKASGGRQHRPGPGHGVGPLLAAAPVPVQCLDVTDVANYLGKKYGGWTPSAEAYGKSGNKWIGIPVATTGGLINYRISSMEKAGFKEFPKDTAALPRACKALKKNNTPAGFALGHASGDANTWLHWALWSHGGNLVDKDDKVIINSPETVKALEFVKALYETFIPGTASWNDSSNNKIFVSGDLHLTVERHLDLRAPRRRRSKAVADDMNHAYMPIGPVGKPTELHLAFPMLTFNFTKAPKACKALHARSCWKRRTSIRGSRPRRATSPTSCSPTTRTRCGRPIPSARPTATWPSAR